MTCFSDMVKNPSSKLRHKAIIEALEVKHCVFSPEIININIKIVLCQTTNYCSLLSPKIFLFRVSTSQESRKQGRK